jgi:hypothetical protein
MYCYYNGGYITGLKLNNGSSAIPNTDTTFNVYTIGGLTLYRSNAYQYDPGSAAGTNPPWSTFWFWSTGSNPFGPTPGAQTTCTLQHA